MSPNQKQMCCLLVIPICYFCIKFLLTCMESNIFTLKFFMFKTIVALSSLEQCIFFLVAGVYRLYFFHELSTN